MAGVFEALADGTRRHILELLSAGEQSAGALVAGVQNRARLSQPAVSQHLRVLLDAGLVVARPEGTQRVYALETAALDAARAWLSAVGDPLASFAQPLDALATEVTRGKVAARSRGGGSARAARQSSRPA